MIRYVVIGAVVGFVAAYFLLSHAGTDVTAPPTVTTSAPPVFRTREAPEEMHGLRPRHEIVLHNRVPLAVDAGVP